MKLLKHCGGYLIGWDEDGKMFRCTNMEKGMTIINQNHPSKKKYYGENGMLREEFWSLPRTENALKFSNKQTKQKEEEL